MLNGQPFYWSTTRRLTSVFGTLFNDIKIVRKDSTDTEIKRFQVPIEYAAKMSWYQSNYSDNFDQGPNISTILPRMSFRLTSMEYDAERKTNSLNTMAANIVGDENSKNKLFAPVPYKFTYELAVYSKYTEDGLQIIEQIIPYFSPSVNVKIKELDDPLVVNDAQFTIISVANEDNYLEQYETQRLQMWTFTIEVSANVYPPINDNKVIRKNIINMDNSLVDPPVDLETVVVTAASGETEDIYNSTTEIINDVDNGGDTHIPPTGIFSDEFSYHFS